MLCNLGDRCDAGACVPIGCAADAIECDGVFDFIAAILEHEFADQGAAVQLDAI